MFHTFIKRTPCFPIRMEKTWWNPFRTSYRDTRQPIRKKNMAVYACATPSALENVQKLAGALYEQLRCMRRPLPLAEFTASSVPAEARVWAATALGDHSTFGGPG